MNRARVTSTDPRPARFGPSARRRMRVRDAALVAVFTVAAMFALAVVRQLELPSFAPPITVDNSTRYDISIQVTDGQHGWMPVGTVHSGTSPSLAQVLDQGDPWIFRFSSQGEDGGELRLSRSQLEANQWQVNIPASVGAELRANGAPTRADLAGEEHAPSLLPVRTCRGRGCRRPRSRPR